jgi:hypothetical protein
VFELRQSVGNILRLLIAWAALWRWQLRLGGRGFDPPLFGCPLEDGDGGVDVVVDTLRLEPGDGEPIRKRFEVGGGQVGNRQLAALQGPAVDEPSFPPPGTAGPATFHECCHADRGTLGRHVRGCDLQQLGQPLDGRRVGPAKILVLAPDLASVSLAAVIPSWSRLPAHAASLPTAKPHPQPQAAPPIARNYWSQRDLNSRPLACHAAGYISLHSLSQKHLRQFSVVRHGSSRIALTALRRGLATKQAAPDR